MCKKILQISKIKESTQLFLICQVCVLSILIFSPAEISAYEIELLWESNPEPDIIGYNLYGKVGQPCPPYNNIDTYFVDELASSIMPEVRVTDLEENTKYYFVVTAFDGSGNESYYSNIVYVINDEWGDANCSNMNLKANDEGGGGGGSGGGCFITSAVCGVFVSNNKLAILIFISLGLFSLTILKGKLARLLI